MTPDEIRLMLVLAVALIMALGVAAYLWWENQLLRGDVEARDDEIRLLEDWIDARDRAERVRWR